MRSALTLLLGATMLMLPLPGCKAAAEEPAAVPGGIPLVAAASDLEFALGEITRRYQADTGRRVRVVFGSSGNLARQIQQGAPHEIFLSADESFVRQLASQGLTRDAGHLYAIGRIVLFAPTGSPLVPDPALRHLAERLRAGRLGKLAIANPEHAPYGRAASEALDSLGLGDAIRPHLVLGENVSQAAQFAASGAAEGGIVAYSLALSPRLRDRGRYALIPEALHEPLRQRMVLLGRATPEGERFYAYLRSPRSRELLERYGFTLPAE